MVELFLPVIVTNLASATLPGLVVVGGLAASLWLFGRSPAAAVLTAFGAITVLGALVLGLVADLTLEYLMHWTFSLSNDPLWYRLERAAISGLEGCGVLLLVLGATVGPAPVEEDE